MTSVSVAATIASRSSWRSSARRSRSPVRGRRARTSSPSTAATRGNTPSSSPTRQTTRWGTERIGTIVQTVSVPVRKLERVGRPRSRWRSRARTSACRSRVVGSPAPGVDPGQLAVELRDLPESAGGVEVSRWTASRQGGRPVGDGRADSAAARKVWRRSTSSANRPTSSRSPSLTSSTGRVPATCRWSSPDIAAPSRTRCMPAAQVLAEAAEAEAAAVVGVVAPADARRGRPSG